MNDSNFEENLTPAAREALNEMLENYKYEIISRASINARKYSDELREISVRDIIASARKKEDKFLKEEYDSRIKRRALWIGTAGIVYLILGLMFFLYFNYDFKFSSQESISLVVTLIGLILALTSVWYYKFKTTYSVYKPETYAHFESSVEVQTMSLLNKWIDIELEISSLIAEEFGESKAAMPISKSLKLLNEKGYLSYNEIDIIKQILDQRNKIVHQGEKVDTTEFQDLINKANKILEKLKEEIDR